MTVEILVKKKDANEMKRENNGAKFIVFLRVKNFTEKSWNFVTNFCKMSIIKKCGLPKWILEFNMLKVRFLKQLKKQKRK